MVEGLYILIRFFYNLFFNFNFWANALFLDYISFSGHLVNNFIFFLDLLIYSLYIIIICFI